MLGWKRFECTCRVTHISLFSDLSTGGKYLSWNRSNFSGTSTIHSGGLDQFYFYQPQHPCVAHHSCCSLLSTKSVQHSNLELFSPPLLFIHHLIHHPFQTCLTHLTQLSPPMPNFWLVNLLLVSGVRLTTLLSAAKVCHCYSCTKN